MAGLIQQQMQQGPAQPQGGAPMQGQQPGMPTDDPAAAMDDDSGPDAETDPAYAQAMELAMQALYKNGAAKAIAEALSKAQDLTQELADTAYEITSIVDERTNGGVPDELIGVLAAAILEEICDIATAAGIEPTGAQMAGAMKAMILRWAGENGIDTTQLQGAMDQVDTSQFDQMDHSENGETPQAEAAETMQEPGETQGMQT